MNDDKKHYNTNPSESKPDGINYDLQMPSGQPKQKPVNKIAQAFKIGIPVILIAGFLWTCSSCFAPNTNSTNTRTTSAFTAPPTTQEQPLLELIDFNDNESSENYFIIKGQVKNLTSYKLDGVEAVVTLYDKGGGFMNYETSFIEYNPIMPNQISPFTVYLDYNPLADKYEVSFKFFASKGSINLN